jgi:chemotaxis protein methyltransferase WspC
VTLLRRGAVTFSSGNVLDAALFEPRSCDVVLCRNLLIYLDRPARGRALENLPTWLRDDGLLFAGHAEAVELMGTRFQRLAEAAPFAYVKYRERPEPGKCTAERAPAPVRARVTTASTKNLARGTAPREHVATAPGASLQRAMELANAGRLAEARAICQRFVQESGASPDAYCLLGLVHKAEGDGAAAADCFNKALYLDPSHLEALVHLTLWHEQRGEAALAANFRRRAERARRGERS